MHVGEELRQAREGLRFSLEQVSARTKIKLERLSAIEEMDAARLPALTYLKGFLRAYAAEVQLDPEDVTERYLAELDVVGGFDIAPPVSLPVVPASEPVATSTGSVSSEEMPSELLQFAPESSAQVSRPASTTAHVPKSESIAPEGPRETPAHVLQPESPPHASQPRYFAAYDVPDTAEVQEPDRPWQDMPTAWPHHTPRRSWRGYVVGLLVLALAVLVGWLAGENSDAIKERAATITARLTVPEDDVATSTAKATTNDATEATGVERGEPKTTEAETPASAAPDALSRAHPPPKNDTRPAKPDAATGKVPSLERSKSSPSAAATEPATRIDESTIDAERAVDSKPRDDGDRGGLSGRWALTNRVESSSYAPFEGMNVGFHLQLQQEGNRVTGTGQKWMENGRPLPPGSRTPIRVEGTLNGGRLELTFTEQGARRTSAGTFVLEVTDQGTLTGTFASDAANAQGTSLARRVGSPRE